MQRFLRAVFLVLCCVSLSNVRAEIENLDHIDLQENFLGPLFISLGSHCEPALMLKECGLRQAAFPFDWIVSFNGDALIEILQDDFLYFLSPYSFVPYGPAGHLLHTYYQLEFLHEGNFGEGQFFANTQKLQEKYQRRIERFRALNRYRGRVFFIRAAYPHSTSDPHRYYKNEQNIEISEANARDLFRAIKEKFPDLNFTLIIINTHQKDTVEIERKLSDRLFMARANPSKDASYMPIKIAAYNQFFSRLSVEGEQGHLTNPLFVSLGSHCEAAVQLRENQVRKGAFPFDWLITLNHEKFIALLNDDFRFFLDEQSVFRDPVNPPVLENHHYEIEFRHDWPFSDLKWDEQRYAHQLKTMREKYERRIARFREIRNHPGHVFFIRTAYDFENGGGNYWWNEKYAPPNAQQAKELREALERYFPDLNFTLIIINYDEDNLPKIEGVEGVVEYKVRKSHKNEDYQKLLREVLDSGI